jgi:hypothetical protein
VFNDKHLQKYRPNPLRPLQHRADCTEFYCAPEERESLFFRGPNAVFHAIEEAAERAGVTFNAQLRYVIELCRGDRQATADDRRTEPEWRALLSQLEICFEDGGTWRPCAAILKTPRHAHRAS